MSFEASELVSTRTRTLRSCSALTRCLRRGGEDEIGRLDEQLLFQLGDPLADERDHLVALLAAGDGFRIVGDDTAVCPHEIVAKLGALGRQLVKVLVDRIGVVGRGDLLTQANQDGIEIGIAIGAIDDGRDRHGRGAVPESVEYPRQIADDRPNRQHVEIAIIGDRVHAIVDVTDIAAADDRRRIVSNHQLVVHAAVDPAEVDNEVESGPTPVGERVEQTNLDIGVSIEGGFNGIAGLVERIVDEEPHPDPAIGRLHHAVDDDPAGRIAVPGVVLHVETLLGQVGQRQTDDEGLAPVAHEAEAGEARMLVGRRAEELAQPGRRGVLERRRHRARIVGPAGGAAGKNLGKPNQDRAQGSATGQCAKLGRTRRTPGSLRVGAHPPPVRNPAGRSAAHGALHPLRPAAVQSYRGSYEAVCACLCKNRRLRVAFWAVTNVRSGSNSVTRHNTPALPS